MKKTFLLFLLLSLISNVAIAREELVINSEAAFIPSHENRLSFLMGLNPSMQKTGDITNLHFAFTKKMDDYWLDSNIILTNGVFSKLTTNNSLSTGLTNEQLIGSKSTHTTIGLGVGRESRYTQTLIPFSDIYELMAANLTYNIFKEPTSTKSFSGPGMMAKFSVYKRFSDYFSVGPQFTYNLAVVKRAQENDLETSSSTSLTVSYLTIGFDLSFYL